ncbi:MAG TPA: hypothetical protein VGP72_10415 [Planctomycetota bacterium]|jgi:hypothetical protein
MASKPRTPEDPRTADLADLLACGLTPGEIRKWIGEQGAKKPEWQSPPDAATLANLLRQAKRAIVAETNRDKGYQYAVALRRLDHLYARSMQINDFKGALAVQVELNRLLGLKREAEEQKATPKAAPARMPAEVTRLLAG